MTVLSPEEMKRLEHAYYDECNKGKDAAIDLLSRLFTSDIVWHSPSGQDVRGLENLKQSFTRAYDAFPDTHYAVEDVIAEGEKSVTRFTSSGTFRGKLEGVESTTGRVETWGIRISRLVNGKFAEVWERYDALGWMRKLGMIRQPDPIHETRHRNKYP